MIFYLVHPLVPLTSIITAAQNSDTNAAEILESFGLRLLLKISTHQVSILKSHIYLLIRKWHYGLQPQSSVFGNSGHFYQNGLSRLPFILIHPVGHTFMS
ncbi:MAG: hypothetical protein P0116_15540 [Candidatus Nitrosocosmicus sp.]|nr:hypothetical protein [Candidatus Nitrosocosmicus sp.]